MCSDVQESATSDCLRKILFLRRSIQYKCSWEGRPLYPSPGWSFIMVLLKLLLPTFLTKKKKSVKNFVCWLLTQKEILFCNQWSIVRCWQRDEYVIPTKSLSTQVE